MPQQPPRACTSPSCPKHALPDKWTCEDHVNVARKAYDARRQSTAARKLYNSADWRNLSAAVKSLNPICQLILDNGQQCTAPSHAVHHLIDPNGDPAIHFDWSILVGICDEHHSKSPGETRNRDFVPTIGMYGVTYPHGSRTAAPFNPNAPESGPYMPAFRVSAYNSENERTAPAQRAQVQREPQQTAQVKPSTPTKKSWGEE